MSDIYSEVKASTSALRTLKDSIPAVLREWRLRRFERNTDGYYYRDGDPDPHCPHCVEVLRIATHLSAAEEIDGGRKRRCRNCKNEYWEKPPVPRRPVIFTASDWISGRRSIWNRF